MSNAAISSVIQKISSLLVEEAIFLHGVRGQVEWMLTELRMMQKFLTDADSRHRKGDELARNWVREVRDVAFEAEDVIDTYLFVVVPLWRKKGLLASAKRYALFVDELVARHKIGTKINRIKNKIQEISDSRTRYGIVNIRESGEEGISFIDENLQARRNLSPYLTDDTTVVGFHEDIKVLLNQLTDAENQRRSVVSIVGMGGLGKTTIAKEIYNNGMIKNHFDVCVWTTISQDYTVTHLLKIIMTRVTGLTNNELEKLEKLDEVSLKEKLHSSLNKRRYLIVMDDVWDINFWPRMKAAFPDVLNGSRVLITTRFIGVARSADSVAIPYELSFMREDKSWELFLLKAFPARLINGNISCPDELEEIGRQLVKKCGGLPLALVVLGGLLSRKDPDPAVWLEVAESMDWELEGQDCLKILALSYCDLPHHFLKSCFLYLAAFPEDSEILSSKLIKLWIAEGFIPHREKQTMEDIARGYLEELVQRCMIQVVKRGVYNKSVKKIRIHDVLREFCIAEAREDGLINVCGVNSTISIIHSTSRRLALQNYSSSWECFSALKVRTLLIFNSKIGNMRHLKLLRVIDLEGVSNLPEGIETMRHLRYIGLRNCESLHKLPPCVGKLHNLQALDIRNTGVRELPKDIFKIQSLRVINMTWGCALPSKIFILRNLQILKDADASGGWIERASGNMINLRVLGISGITNSQLSAFCCWLVNLDRLVSLKICRSESLPSSVITNLSNNHRFRKLEIRGMLGFEHRRLPGHHLFPQYLSKLTLQASMLLEDPMPVLEKLQYLVVLRLRNQAYVGTEIVCSTGGFPRLQLLELSCLAQLKCWKIEGCAMLNLTYLYISVCPKLHMLPEGLQSARYIKELKLSGMSDEFQSRVCVDSDDWHKIQHVHSIEMY